MKRTLLGVVGILALLIAAPMSTAFAADMPIKSAPPPAPVITSDWTGFYFDVDAGWQRSTYNWQYTNPAPVTCCAPFSMSSTDGVVGAHVGYQQQFGWIVVGGEGGASKPWNSQHASNTGCINTVPLDTCQAIAFDITTIGGKLGVAWQDWLLYGVGGSARGTVQTQLRLPVAGLFDTTGSQSRTGWYAGGGVDFMALKTRLLDVIVGAEYEHIDLRSALMSSSADGFAPAGVNARNISAKEDIVWAKLTVKWNPFAP